MANYLKKSFKNKNVEFFDLQENPLPMCDGDECYDLPEVIDFRSRIDKANGIIMAIPIYNFNVSSGAKNIVELGGKKLYDKNFGFLCAAGGKNSYMSVMGLANSLMIDYRCYIIPKFVYALKKDFDETKVIDADIKERIEELGNEMIRITKALSRD
jgi:FMN reductase